MINLKNIEAGGKTEFKALDEGWYGLKVSEAVVKPTSKGGKMIETTFNIVEPENLNNRKVWNNFNLGATSLWALKNFLEKAGSDIINEENISEADIAKAMKGLEVDGYLVPDKTNTGKPINRVANYKERKDTPVSVNQHFQ